jgi:copper resistance protein D
VSGMGLAGAGGVALVLLHGAALAALLSAFGSLLFLGFAAPPAAARLKAAERTAARRLCSSVACWSLGLAILLELAWLVGLSAFLAGATGPGQVAAAILVVIRATLFGQAVVGQILALVAAAAVFGHGSRTRIAAGLAGLATALEAWHLHGAAMHAGPSPILVAELLHVLAAGAWLGGLLPLALFIRVVPPEAGALAARRFSTLATPCVVVLAATALWQGGVLVGSLAALFGTPYGWMALVKLGLFLTLLAFAIRHRWRLTPALSGAEPFVARRILARSVFGEMAIGLAIVLVAAVISSLAPATDMAMPSRQTSVELPAGHAEAAPAAAPG